MVRVLALLALAVSSVGCSAFNGPGCCNPVGCGDACCESDCGCGDTCACGTGCDTGGCDSGCCDSGCCNTSCGDAGCCTECGCEAGCGCGTNCGGGCCAGGLCGHITQDCPICQDCRNCCLFRRGRAACGYDQCGVSGPCYNNYDYSACQQCGGGPSWGCCGKGCCGCCETYSGCCCQPQGPGCCASGDHRYNFAPGPPVGQTAYPYYTTRGPRDFLMANPPSIGPY
jgi:hypothetical protein